MHLPTLRGEACLHNLRKPDPKRDRETIRVIHGACMLFDLDFAAADTHQSHQSYISVDFA